MLDPKLPEMKMDTASLVREEVFTDQRIGTIRKMIPVTIEGELDSSRPVQFIGQAQMMTPSGALPLHFELEVSTLQEAIEQFGDAAEAALKRTIEELKEMQRQAASSIVIPESGAMSGMGGMPGGGKIQMP